MTRHITQTQMYRAVVAVRWIVLLLIPVQIGLEQSSADAPKAIAAVAVAAGYTLLLTILTKPVLKLHARGLGFIVIDLAMAAALYSSGPYTKWSFFLFGTTTILFAGLRGRVVEGLVVGLTWNALTIPIQLACGLPVSDALDINALEDVFNLTMVACIWAYSVGLVGKLNVAYDDLSASTEELARANAHLDEREREILTLMEAGNTLMREFDLDSVLRIVVDSLSSMGFGPCRVWVLEEDVLRAVYPADETVPDVSVASGGPLSSALRGREPVAVPAEGQDMIPGLDPARLAIAVPVMTEDEVLGVLALESLSGEPYDDDERELLALFADQVALAVQHVRFLDYTQELAVAEERVRLTHEIHDTVVQKIYGANLIAEALCREPVPPETGEKLQMLSETILASLKDLRFAVLNWDSLDWREGLGGLVERYAAEYATLTGIGVSVVLRGRDHGAHSHAGKDVVRALQTALSNVRTHAHAQSVQIELDRTGAGTTLVIRDNGRGFDARDAEKKPTGGIAEMRRRLRRRNGIVEVISAPGDGTQFRVWVPD